MGSTSFEIKKELSKSVYPVESSEVRVREFYIAMQRCPYIHEMKERLLGAGADERAGRERARPDPHHDPQVGTIVKLNSDGYGSHTSPAHAPLVVDDCEVPCGEADPPTPSDCLIRHRTCCQPDVVPKNANSRDGRDLNAAFINSSKGGSCDQSRARLSDGQPTLRARSRNSKQ
ncbi:hypothetical protein EVAR_57269_1 [Eumeta japonica]|uniref:Uncharacterized protein n=1 Tax=Eumeta variegata TaxID=151549 RepID=A0A4C1ZXX6_EUMVA|nr:hypothetical protein EVAR_57269_1 [Eumeta japonica]